MNFPHLPHTPPPPNEDKMIWKKGQNFWPYHSPRRWKFWALFAFLCALALVGLLSNAI